MATDVYQNLNQAWKLTTKILFGEEVGELKDYEEWLLDYGFLMPVEKDGIYLGGELKKAKRTIAYEEISKLQRFEPLNINEIKDIDSIFEALKERFTAVGSLILGNSKHIEKSTEVADSYNVYYSRTVYSSKNVAYSAFVRESQNVFGSNDCAVSQFAIKASYVGGKLNSRVFEGFVIAGSANIYYSSNILYSSEVMFSFGLQGKHYVIGNIQLPKDKYLRIKKALLEQMRDELKANKSLPSLADILGQDIRKGKELFDKIKLEEESEHQDKSVIERAFSKTTKVILKKELQGLDEFEKFLSKHLNFYDNITYNISPISKKKVYVLPKLWLAERFLHKCLLWEEVFELSKYITNEITSFDEAKNSELYISFDARENYANVIETVCAYYSQHAYMVADSGYSKYSAFSIWPRNSTYVFGTFIVHASSSVINGSNSYRVARGFEINSCRGGSDLYFSHGLTDVRNAMFSFGLISRNYLIGNTPYSPGEYNKLKENLLDQIVEELEEKKDLKYSVFSFLVE